MATRIDADIMLRYGTQAEYDAGKHKIRTGEAAVTTDTKRLFVGTGEGEDTEIATAGSVASGLDEKIDKADIADDTVTDSAEKVLSAAAGKRLADAATEQNGRIGATEIGQAKNTSDIQKLEQSLMSVGSERITVSDVGEVDIPVNALQAPCGYKIYGNTVKNITSWSADAQVLTKPSKGVFKGVGSGTYYEPHFCMHNSKFENTGQHYFKAIIRAQDSGCTEIRVVNGSTTLQTISSPTANTNYNISISYNRTNSADNLVVYFVYPTKEIADGKTQYIENSFLVALDYYIQNLPADKLERMFGDWFDESAEYVNVVAPRLRSVDENNRTISELYHAPIAVTSYQSEMFTDNQEYIKDGDGWFFCSDIWTLTESKNVSSGTIISAPNGKILAEPYIADVGVAREDLKVEIFNKDYPIASVESAWIMQDDGTLKEPAYGYWIIDNDRFAFGNTYIPFDVGAIVFFTYKHSVPTLLPQIDIEYLNSDKVRLDTETGTPYRLDWKVSNGELILTTEEVT